MNVSSRLVDIIREDIERLSVEAVNAALLGEYRRSSLINELILRMSQANRVRLPRERKLTMCKRCHVSLIPGVTLSVRVRSQGRFRYLVRRCLVCGYIHRLPLANSEPH
ncbi:MAG: ribonuclease P protein component 4 [Acidilobus sp.]